jgi:hypothetical protein
VTRREFGTTFSGGGLSVSPDQKELLYVATAGRSQFAGMNEASFISAVRDAILRFPSRQ